MNTEDEGMTQAVGNWVRVALAEEIPEGERMAVRPNGRRVLLLRREGTLYALENDCPHLGCAFTRGEFRGYALSCPCHDWTFDIRTGAFHLASEIKLATYPCRVEAGEVQILIGGDDDGSD